MSYLNDTLSIESVAELSEVADALDAHHNGQCLLNQFDHPSRATRPVATAAHLLCETGLSAGELSAQLRAQIGVLQAL
jgi:hypothetical protein